MSTFGEYMSVGGFLCALWAQGLGNVHFLTFYLEIFDNFANLSIFEYFVLNVACPQRFVLNVAVLNVFCPQCPIGQFQPPSYVS